LGTPSRISLELANAEIALDFGFSDRPLVSFTQVPVEEGMQIWDGDGADWEVKVCNPGTAKGGLKKKWGCRRILRLPWPLGS